MLKTGSQLSIPLTYIKQWNLGFLILFPESARNYGHWNVMNNKSGVSSKSRLKKNDKYLSGIGKQSELKSLSITITIHVLISVALRLKKNFRITNYFKYMTCHGHFFLDFFIDTGA